MSTTDRIVAFIESVDAYVLARYHWATAMGMLDEHLKTAAERQQVIQFDFDKDDESHYRRQASQTEIAVYQAHEVIKTEGEALHRDLPRGDARRLIRETLARLVPLLGSGRGVDIEWLQNTWPSIRLEIQEAVDSHRSSMPSGKFIAAPQLASALDRSEDAVNGQLKAIVKRRPDCRIEVPGRRTGEPQYLYRTGDVWPELARKFSTPD